jgi:spermidine synthase
MPLLLHEAPSEVLFMGLGTGLTAGGAIPHHDVERILAVELIPEVVEAVRTLADYNYNVVDHPKVNIHIDDARHFLLANNRKFDVIVSDMFVPWESESGYLYTVEHYRVAAQRLRPGGLFCQWLPLYQVGEREFESIANSFASEFPCATLWWGDMNSSSPVIALIGTELPLRIDEHRLSMRLADLSQQMGSTDPAIATSDRFWDHYLGDWNARSSLNLNTDEHPRVEFLTPISNRDRQMLRSNRLESYCNEVLLKLPRNGAQRFRNRQKELP